MAEPSRAERLFEAHKSFVALSWKEGVKWFRQRRTLTKTLQTQLTQLQKDGAAVLSPADHETLVQTIAVLARLNGDFELAERRAKRYVAGKEDQHAQAERDRLDAIAATWLGEAPSAAEITACAEDIAGLVALSGHRPSDTLELQRILGTGARLRRPVYLPSDVQQIRIAGQPWPTLLTLELASRTIARWLASNVKGVDPYITDSPSIERETWAAWRAHRQRMRALLATAVHDPAAD